MTNIGFTWLYYIKGWLRQGSCLHSYSAWVIPHAELAKLCLPSGVWSKGSQVLRTCIIPAERSFRKANILTKTAALIAWAPIMYPASVRSFHPTSHLIFTTGGCLCLYFIHKRTGSEIQGKTQDERAQWRNRRKQLFGQIPASELGAAPPLLWLQIGAALMAAGSFVRDPEPLSWATPRKCEIRNVCSFQPQKSLRQFLMQKQISNTHSLQGLLRHWHNSRATRHWGFHWE